MATLGGWGRLAGEWVPAVHEQRSAGDTDTVKSIRCTLTLLDNDPSRQTLLIPPQELTLPAWNGLASVRTWHYTGGSKRWRVEGCGLMYWQCSCGEQFEEVGDRQSLGMVMVHLRKAKQENGQEHRIMGLYADDGERVIEGWNPKKAQIEGYLPKGKLDEPGDGDAGDEAPPPPKKPGKSPFRAQMRYVHVELDPTVYILFDIARTKWPEEYPDDSPETFSRWLRETVLAFYYEYRETMGISKLFEEALRGVATT